MTLKLKISEEKKESERSFGILKDNIEGLNDMAKDKISNAINDLESIVDEKKSQVDVFFNQHKAELQDRNKDFDNIISSVKDHL